MQSLLDNPVVQAGVAPLFVALVVAFALSKTRFAWLGIVAGYATMIALTTGFVFAPLTAGRKVTLLCLAAPLIGIVLDLLPKRSRSIAVCISIVAGGLAIWAFVS